MKKDEKKPVHKIDLFGPSPHTKEHKMCFCGVSMEKLLKEVDGYSEHLCVGKSVHADHYWCLRYRVGAPKHSLHIKDLHVELLMLKAGNNKTAYEQRINYIQEEKEAAEKEKVARRKEAFQARKKLLKEEEERDLNEKGADEKKIIIQMKEKVLKDTGSDKFAVLL